MNHYSPFERGPHPVGVKSVEINYQNAARKIPVECWFPAIDTYDGKDLDAKHQDKYAMAPGFPENPQSAVRDAEAKNSVFPLIIFSHGFAGHRRQTTHLCCHLASHGYIVVSPDHVGNTLMDIMGLVGQMQKKGFASMAELFKSFKDNRPKDASQCINETLAGNFGLKADPDKIGICGHSFGGWTSLATTIEDARISALVPLAPAGGQSKNSIANGFDFSLGKMQFTKEVPCLYLVADQDSLLPLDSMQDLFHKTPEPKRMIVLQDSDHFHFCDNVEFIHDMMTKMGSGLFGGNNENGALSKMKKSTELCPGKDAYAFLQASTLAHMDAYIRNQTEAKTFLEKELLSELKNRNIRVQEFV
jgi:dienelactone hydrolase